VRERAREREIVRDRDRVGNREKGKNGRERNINSKRYSHL